MPSVSELLDSKAVLSGISATVGALFWNYVIWSRGRVRVLDYTVTHDRVGLSAADVVLGEVAVTWQGTPVANLFLSTVVLENNTSANLTDLTIRTWTGADTFLLNERREMVGTVFSPGYTAAYAQSIHVPEGHEPTAQQQQIYWHGRDYHLPVFNRNQSAKFQYLTTAAQDTGGPRIWVDLQHQGLRVEIRPGGPVVYGVPVAHALIIGLMACALVLVTVVMAEMPTWLAAATALLSGLAAQAIGAGLYRIGRFLFRVVFH